MTWQAQLQLPTLAPEQFRKVIQDMLAERHADLEVAVEDELSLRITLDQRPLVWNLDRTYQHTMSAEADTRDAILANIVSDLVGHLRGTFEAEPETRGERLMPVLRRRDYIASHPTIIAEPFSDELCVAYVIDHPTTVEYVMADALAELGIDRAQLRQVAVANLWNRMSPSIEEGDTTLAMLICGGTFESSFALMDEMVDHFASQCDGELVAGFPANDMFIFADTGTQAGVDALIATAKHIVENGDNPLSKELFKRTDGKWVLWTP